MHRRIRDGERLRFSVTELMNLGVEWLEIDYAIIGGKSRVIWDMDLPYQHLTKEQLDFQRKNLDNSE